ncbi:MULTISPECIES: subclass B3 metallo-beta-lactamase [Chryseobacterium]|uniref:Metallo-beta-lactamase class B n=1 Tax=Chryseobacterium geocarposphaerae TaxID=1416776 RepID=A0ABU1LH15_9FLAO|nr:MULTISPECIES: subclass B3 metallo-beta-lactamase [Chryseobacterium]MDR6406007.1 metallo-beta-lactamase class B [Chryseobacterium geocarposphaerae]MDR6699548.1 metallo-beta-lactamase class B [Chryseobacterium ginsenosidimutans]
MKRIILVFLMIISFIGNAQTVNEPKNNPEEWSKMYEPFRVAGNLYYVGTYDLASYLIVTDKGNILINTGLADSLPIIKNNIKKLGFKYKDIKILTLTQAHFDHMGAMADIKKETGAKLYVDEKDAQELKSGGKSDYELGKYGVTFKPVNPDFLLKNNDKIKLGNTTLTLLHHPGHTKGSCSFLFETKNNNQTYKVLIANLPSIIIDRKFSDVKDYQNIQKDYAETFKAMKNVDFDIWVASHASQFDLHTKRKEGDSYNPKLFTDKEVYFQKLGKLEADYLEKVKQDSAEK